MDFKLGKRSTLKVDLLLFSFKISAVLKIPPSGLVSNVSWPFKSRPEVSLGASRRVGSSSLVMLLFLQIL